MKKRCLAFVQARKSDGASQLLPFALRRSRPFICGFISPFVVQEMDCV